MRNDVVFMHTCTDMDIAQTTFCTIIHLIGLFFLNKRNATLFNLHVNLRLQYVWQS